MTIYEVKRIHESKDPDYFFSRETMKYFGQTLRDFRVTSMRDGKFLVQVSMGNTGEKSRMARWAFDPETGKLDPIIEENTR